MCVDVDPGEIGLCYCSVLGYSHSGRLCSLRTPSRSYGVSPLISRSMANSSSMRLTASIAIGALSRRGEIEEVAPPVCPTRDLDDRARLAGSAIEAVEPGIGVRLHQPNIARQMLLRSGE